MNLKKMLVGVGVVSVVFGVGCSRKPEAPAKVLGEEGIKEAKAEAQAAFEDFRARVQKQQPGDRGFKAKIEVKDENGAELVWVTDLKLDAEPYACTIASEPVTVKNLKWKDDYTFSKEDVCDWMYWAGDIVQGNYMVRAALKSMPSGQAERLKKQMGW